MFGSKNREIREADAFIRRLRGNIDGNETLLAYKDKVIRELEADLEADLEAKMAPKLRDFTVRFPDGTESVIVRAEKLGYMVNNKTGEARSDIVAFSLNGIDIGYVRNFHYVTSVPIEEGE